jgi:NADH dehydrogenase FAD-containing subunit
MTQRVLKGVYRNLNFSKSRVILVDVVHTVLNAFSERSQIYASEMLKKHGVEVLLGVGVKEVHPSYVVLSDGSTILPPHYNLGRRTESIKPLGRSGDQDRARRPH